MQFTPKNRDDIIRYYKGTYLKLKEFGDQLFFIENIEHNKVTGQHQDGGPFIMYLNDDTPYEVEYILPHKSFFQHGPNAVQLQRIPAKQYSRGLCAANTQLSFLSGSSQLTLPLNFEVLKQFVGKQAFFKLVQAIGANECTTCALTPRMMYRRSDRTIFMDFTPIAKVNVGKLTITMTKPIFMDEVKDWIRETGDNFTVQEYVAPPPKEKTKTEDLLKEMGAKKKYASSYNLMPQAVQMADWDAAVDVLLGDNQ